MFFSNIVDLPNYTQYQERREKLVRRIKEEYSDIKKGKVLLFGGFAKDCIRFRQESAFLYFSGIKQPSCVLSIDIGEKGASSLYVPNCVEFRKQWVGDAIEPTKDMEEIYKLKKIDLVGESFRGTGLEPYFKKKEVACLLKVLTKHVENGESLFVLNPKDTYSYDDPRRFFARIRTFVPEVKDQQVKDISPIVAAMRRCKDMSEIVQMDKAMQTTFLGHEAIVKSMKDGAYECEVVAAFNYVVEASGFQNAYPPIVNCGKRATILHCEDNSAQMSDGQLLLVDAGAEIDNYCTDISRTYPISGKFTERQREVYSIVLAAQKYIADIIKPGYCIRDRKNPKNSLQCLVLEFLKEKGGYDKYMNHGVGHYLGLEIHDVGDPFSPLKEGDVITIEPGIYIPEENIGIRIEDNYWITKDGVVCLSDGLPKEPDQVEKFIQYVKSGKSWFDDDSE